MTRITGNPIASILLSQFLYWSDKTKDGWIWKTTDELTEETGLTKWQQQTAKRILVEKELIVKERKRLSHTTRYKVNVERMDELWEEATKAPVIREEKPKEKTKEKPKEKTKEEAKEEPKEEILKEEPKESKFETKEIPVYDEEGNLVRVRRTALAPKGDIVDALIAFSQSPKSKQESEMRDIRSKIEAKFDIIADSGRWQKFIEFAYKRQEKFGESIDTFLDWAMNQDGFSVVYWTPEKMKTLYPQAFIKPKAITEEFPPLPVFKEKECAPMPKDLGTQRQQY